MAEPLVSIVIPCYRQGHLLGQAIESALGQTSTDTEVVVVNDGSDDDTEAVARSYGDRLTLISKPNGGLCSARNAGIRAATGRYLLFLDADDLLHREALQWLIACMEGREDRLGLMGFRFFEDEVGAEGEGGLLPSQGAAWFARFFEIDPLFLERPPGLDATRLAALPYLIYTNFGPPHCWMSSRRRVLELNMFDERLGGCGDWDLWLRLSLAGAELVTANRVGAFYRRYAGSMSRDDRHMLDDRARVLLKTARTLRAQPEALACWGRDLLQAARRVRRRYAAFGLRSSCVGRLTEEILFLRRFETPASRRIAPAVGERILGSTWDRIALRYYRKKRPDLWDYYRADTD